MTFVQYCVLSKQAGLSYLFLLWCLAVVTQKVFNLTNRWDTFEKTPKVLTMCLQQASLVAYCAYLKAQLVGLLCKSLPGYVCQFSELFMCCVDLVCVNECNSCVCLYEGIRNGIQAKACYITVYGYG